MKKWTTGIKTLLKTIQNFKPADRLDYASAITICNIAMATSVNGWTRWLSDPRILNQISEKDLKKYFGEFQKIAKTFLELDVEATEKYQIKQPEEPTVENPLVM